MRLQDGAVAAAAAAGSTVDRRAEKSVSRVFRDARCRLAPSSHSRQLDVRTRGTANVGTPTPKAIVPVAVN